MSDSGLGCGPGGSGFHGWPFCNGDVVPGHRPQPHHRVHPPGAGGGREPDDPRARRAWRGAAIVSSWASRSALMLLILAQAGLGGATVEENLDEALVAAHLGLAMLLLGGLLYVWRGAEGVRPESGGPRILAIAASAAVFCTVVAGGYMAGTQNYGRPDYQLGDGAHHACGKEFPTCNGDFMPFGQSRLVDIHLTHRAFMYLASVLLISLIVVPAAPARGAALRARARRSARDPDPRRRAERVAGRVRVADRAAPRARARCCGRPRSRPRSRSRRPARARRAAAPRRWRRELAGARRFAGGFLAAGRLRLRGDDQAEGPVAADLHDGHDDVRGRRPVARPGGAHLPGRGAVGGRRRGDQPRARPRPRPADEAHRQPAGGVGPGLAAQRRSCSGRCWAAPRSRCWR